MRSRTWILLAYLFLMTMQVSGQSAPVGSRTVTLNDTCSDFAIDPSTGAVAAIDSSGNTLTIYPRSYLDGKDNKVLGPTKVGASPASVVFKSYKDKSYFVVACRRDQTLWVVDSATAQEVKAIKAELDSPYLAIASLDVADPYVYYVGGTDTEAGVAQVSLDEMKDRGKLHLWGPNEPSTDAAISADGTMLYTRGSWIPTGFEVSKRHLDPDGKERWTQLLREHDSRGKYVPDPFNVLLVAGDMNVYSANLKKKIGSIDGEPLCFLSDCPLLIGRKTTHRTTGQREMATLLVAYSTVTLKAVGSVNLSDMPGMSEEAGPRDEAPNKTPRVRPAKSDTKRVASPIKCLPDPVGDRLLVAFGNKIAVIPMESFNLSKEPVPLVRITVPERAAVGETLTIPFRPISPETTVELKDGPAGMKLQAKDHLLTWTPSVERTGTVAFTLKTSSKAGAMDQSFEVEVSQPYIRLPFFATGLEISPSGRYAVVFARPLDMKAYAEKSQEPSLALVDLEQRKILAQKTLHAPISAAAVDDQAVYIAPGGSDRLESLQFKDLSADKSVNTDGPVLKIEFGGKSLVLTMAKSLSVYGLPELKKRDLPLRNVQRPGYTPAEFDGMAFGDGHLRQAIRCQGGWSHQGLFFSDDFSTLWNFLSPKTLPPLPNGSPLGAAVMTATPVQWARRFHQGQLQTSTGQNIARIRPLSSSELMTDVPAVAMAWTEHPFATNRGTIKLQVLDLLNGKAILDRILRERTFNLESGQEAYEIEMYEAGHLQCLATAGRRILATIGAELFVTDLTDEMLKQLPLPLEIEVPREVAVLSAKGPAKLALTARGGEKPIVFGLESAMGGIDIDKTTGVISVDTGALSKRVLETVLATPPSRTGTKHEVAGQKTLDDYLTTSRSEYKLITGKEVAWMPVLVPLSVTATDKNQQKARLDFQVVLEVPQDAVQTALAEAAAGVKKQEEEARTEQEARERDAEVARLARLGFVASQPDSERVERLEKRVSELEGKIDLLIKLLQDKQKKQN